MKKVIICGGGPIGLALAIFLTKKGVEGVVVYEPREEYTRPGHLNNDAFSTIGKLLNITHWDFTKTAHIKDIERELAQIAQELNIQVEHKRFVNFINLPEKKGVVVQSKDGEKTEVECDIAFDCTGQARVLVHAINALCPNYFTLKPIIADNDLLIKRHFLAYVKMKPNYRISLANSSKEFYDSKRYVTFMEKFRQLGWKEFTHPFLYQISFGKDKTCIYVEQPDHLSPDLYEEWLKLALQFHSYEPSITYELCSESKKGLKKPRLNSFIVNPHELSPSIFEGNRDLPIVLTAGDVTIDANYRLANGVKHGFLRIEALSNNLQVSEGQIVNFDKDQIESDLKPYLSQHRDELIKHYQANKKKIDDALNSAKIHYRNILNATKEPKEQAALQNTLRIIEARIAYKEVILRLASQEDAQFIPECTYQLRCLNQIHAYLINAYFILYQQEEQLRSNLSHLIYRLAQYYELVAADLFQKKQVEHAMEAYQKTLELFQLENTEYSLKNEKKEEIIEKFILSSVKFIDTLKSEPGAKKHLPLLIAQSMRYLSQNKFTHLQSSLALLAKHGYIDLNTRVLSRFDQPISSFFFKIKKNNDSSSQMDFTCEKEDQFKKLTIPFR